MTIGLRIRNLTLALLLILGAQAAAFGQSADIPNFYQVSPQIFRGGQPAEKGIAELARLGIRTVIDLRGGDGPAVKEKALVEKAGMRFIAVDLSNWLRPKTSEIDSIVRMLEAADSQPVFVHCRRGSDRTGTVIAVYRMLHDGWNADQASDEAKKFGMGWWQVWMKDFIRDYYRDLQAKENVQRRVD